MWLPLWVANIIRWFRRKVGYALIYKAELHNTITRSLDDSYSYVKLIGNDDSAFFQFQNYSFKLRGQLCCIEAPNPS